MQQIRSESRIKQYDITQQQIKCSCYTPPSGEESSVCNNRMHHTNIHLALTGDEFVLLISPFHNFKKLNIVLQVIRVTRITYIIFIILQKKTIFLCPASTCLLVFILLQCDNYTCFLYFTAVTVSFQSKWKKVCLVYR